MLKKLFLVFFGLMCGIVAMIGVLKYFGIQKPIVIGFLPYWLVGGKKDYSPYVDIVAYFGLTVGSDGAILKRTKPTETEPGWLTLQSGKMNNRATSLVVFSGNQEAIDQLMEKPVEHAQHLMNEVSPILTQFGFTDLNLDIENVSIASQEARENFTLFTKTIHDLLQKNNTVSLSIDVSPTALIKPYLIDVAAISPYVEKIIFMTYDFHFQGSSVTGAISPVNGAGISAEFDAQTSIREALKILEPDKIILGVPLYGYEWETLSDHPHAAVIPGSGITASNKRVEALLAKCATCSARFDPIDQESHLIFKDAETGTFHQIFYPDKQAMQAKIDLIKKYKLGGIALWALGYEGNAILEPLKEL